MKLKPVSIALVATAVCQGLICASSAQAQYIQAGLGIQAGTGYGGYPAYGGGGGGAYLPAQPACAYGGQPAQGASDSDDEIAELVQLRAQARSDMRSKKRELTAATADQEKQRGFIEDVMQSRWSDAAFQHMDNGWDCCDPRSQPQPQPQPVAPQPPVTPPEPPKPLTPNPDPCPEFTRLGSDCSGKHKKRVTPKPDSESALDRPEGNRAPASISASVDGGQNEMSMDRGPAQAIPLYPPGPPLDATAAAQAAAAPAQSVIPPGAQFYSNPAVASGAAAVCDPRTAGPGWEDVCSNGDSGDAARTCRSSDSPVPFGYPAFLSICDGGGGIKSRACTSRFYQNGGSARGAISKCVSALPKYRKDVKTIDRLNKEISDLEQQISDYTDSIGEERSNAKQDALEGDCAECRRVGNHSGGGGGPAGPTTAQTIVGGGLAALGLGLGYVANQQLNSQNKALGWPGQSFAPYAGYWTGQGIVQAAFGTPYAQGGLYGGVPGGVNGGFGCGQTIGQPGAVFAPQNAFSQGGIPIGSGGMYQPGYIPPYALNGGGFNNGGSSGGIPISSGGIPIGGGGNGFGGNGFGGGIAPFGNSQFGGSQYNLGGQYAGNNLVPYGNQGGGWNPMAYGAYPGVPGSGALTFGGGANYYDQYNPLGGSPFYGGANSSLYAAAINRGYNNGITNYNVGANLYSQLGSLNTNLGQLNSGYSYPYSVSGGQFGGTNNYSTGVLGVGNNGAFGVSPLGISTGLDTSDRSR